MPQVKLLLYCYFYFQGKYEGYAMQHINDVYNRLRKFGGEANSVLASCVI